MIPAGFDYHRPASVDEALKLLGEHEDDAKLLAGGHSLIPAMKLRLATPTVLIDIGGLNDLKNIDDDGKNLIIGANVTHRMLEDSDLVKEHAPELAQSAAVIGDPSVRNMGTLGGSLAHADPAADYPAAILSSGATIRVIGPEGQRDIEADEYFMDLFLTALGPDEIITHVLVPKLDKGASAAYAKFPQPASRFAVVGCAVRLVSRGVNCEDIKVAFTGVANAAFRDESVENALKGKKMDAETIAAAAAQAANGQEILSDAFADEAYRTNLAKIYAKRVLMQAAGL